jgi:hypothetical protein
MVGQTKKEPQYFPILIVFTDSRPDSFVCLGLFDLFLFQFHSLLLKFSIMLLQFSSICRVPLLTSCLCKFFQPSNNLQNFTISIINYEIILNHTKSFWLIFFFPALVKSFCSSPSASSIKNREL